MENFFMSLSSINIFIVATITALCLGLFLFRTFFPRTNQKLKINPFLNLISKPDFYKVPFIWLSIILIAFLAIFRKKERIYLKHITSYSKRNISRDDTTEISRLISLEPFYWHALWQDRTIKYFETLSMFKSIEKDNNQKKSLFEKIDLIMGSVYYDKRELDNFEYKRFDVDTWIPKKSLLFFMEKEYNRVNRHQHFKKLREERAFVHSLNEGFDDIDFVMRNISENKIKRFN